MRAEKQLLLEDLKEQINDSKAFVIFNYSGVKANDMADFRGEVHANGGYIEMVPKRILRKAASEAGIDFGDKELPGHIGLAFSADEGINTTKVVFKFAKSSKALEVLGGSFDERLLGPEQVKALSELPSQDEMRAQLLGLFQAPMAQTLSVMNALVCSVCYALKNKIEKEGGTN
jgi:large subunit ribosomal protein L10